MIRYFAAAAIAALSFSFVAHANPVPPPPAEEEPNGPPTEGAWGMEGQFVFNQADGKAKGCRLDLWKDEKDGHYTTKPDADCAAQFEFISKIAGWDLAGDAGFALVGADGTIIIEMQPSEAEPAIYKGTSTLDGRDYYMERISG